MLQTPHGIHEWRLLGLNLFLKECAFDFSSHDKTSHITLRFSILAMCLFPIIWTWTVAKQYKPTAAMQVLLIGISTIVSIVNIYIYTHTAYIYSACLPPFLGCILSDPYSCRLCCINRCERSFMTSECLGIIGMRHCSPCFGSWCWLSWPFMCLGLSWQGPAPGNQFLGGIMKLLWWLATIIMTAATSTSPSWKDLCLKRYPILLPVTRSMSGQGMCFGDDQPHRPQMRFDLPSRKGIPFHLVALAIPGYSYSILL